ncbi:MAG: exosortase-associated EpsI family protein [Phycisphaerales bacterium]
MTSGRSILRGVRRLGNRGAPLLTLALFCAAPVVLARAAGAGPDVEHLERIRKDLETTPLRIGRWIGTLVPVPTEAKEILRPNALLSRRYVEIGGANAAILMIAHCSDVRDMVGHYPPVCYRANGWTLETDRIETTSVTLSNGWTMPMRVYRFVRAERGGGERRMSVLSGFLLPDGEIVVDMESLTGRSERRGESAKGVAQVQLVFDGDLATEVYLATARELLDGLPRSLLQQLGAVIGGDAPRAVEFRDG